MSDNCEPVSETIFSLRNNSFTLEYELPVGKLVDFSNTTKVEFILNAKPVNSIDDPAFFDFLVGTDGRIIFKLGEAGYVSTDAGPATIIVFDASNPLGAIFTSEQGPTRLTVNVKG